MTVIAALVAIVALVSPNSDPTWALADAAALLRPTVEAPIAVAPAPAVRVDKDQVKADQDAGLYGGPDVPRGIQDKPFAPEGLSNCGEMTFYRKQWNLPSAFDGIGYRESNCRNEDSVHTSCCHGYWQLHEQHFADGNVFDRECGVDSYTDVNSDTPLDKQRQACATHELYQRDGTAPWAATR